MRKTMVGLLAVMLGVSVWAQEPGDVITVSESWCDMELPAAVKVGEEIRIKLTLHGLEPGMKVGCVVKAISRKGKEAGVVARFKRINGAENEREYIMTAVLNECPQGVNTVGGFFTVSPDSDMKNRIHSFATPLMQIIR